MYFFRKGYMVMNISANFSAGIQEKKYHLPSYPLPAPEQSTKPTKTTNNNKKIIAALGALAAAGAAAVAIAVSLKKGKAPDIETSDVAKATQKLSPEKKELLMEFQNLYNEFLACGPERNEINRKYYLKLQETIEHFQEPKFIKENIETVGGVENAPLLINTSIQVLSSNIKGLNKKLNDNIDAPKSFNDIIDKLKAVYQVEDISEVPGNKIKALISGIKGDIKAEMYSTEKRKQIFEPFMQSLQEESLTNKLNILGNPPKDMSLDSYAATYEEVYNTLQNLRTKTYNALEEFKKSH